MRRRLAIAVAALAAFSPVSRAQSPYPAVISSSVVWSIPDEAFGGWSGIEVDDDGVGFTVVSDRGLVTSGRLIRTDRGRLIGAEGGPILSLTHTDGGPLPRFFDDSEGLAIAADGRMFVSFEAEHRIMEYADVTGDSGTELPRAEAFAEMQNNSSLEALAIGPDGALYTLPERSGAMARPFPVFRYKDGAWDQPFDIPRRDEFLPVGADIGPDGRFYLLERDLSTSDLGFSTRVRRFDMSDTDLTGEVTLLVTSPRTHDNLEGISVWQDDLQQIRIVMVADDNQRFFQKNEIVEYIVVDDPLPATGESLDPVDENL
ncbi:esterase-like activity of phytase family protein [Maritimibacter sp. DP1N21-5]|uniref:esterase-like activity of phytase family protein n=1 Tax=Maritimibacter sp. DP1N21-5 TaxID=2836867 RepID=UPI001C483050|nr:esterase-like activity of phytase family protein [Maritimibacter sp. DP1N21-5]MBV7408290.1 esterase-like activity of phytase family protein [Maritimibacter sp. DP1N21-5]